MKTRLACLTALAFGLVAAPALAQPSLTPAAPAGEVAQPKAQAPSVPAPSAAPAAAPAPATPAPKKSARKARKPSRLAVGAHIYGGTLSEQDTVSDSKLTGAGLFARYRLTGRWHVELALGRIGLEMSADRNRSLVPVQMSALMNFFARGGFSAYLRAGMGYAKETYDSGQTQLEFENRLMHVGGGLMYRLRSRNLGMALETRGVSVQRSETGRTDVGNQTSLGLLYFF